MFHHYSDVLDNKLQLAIGIVGIVTGLCFHLLPRLPKIISIANHETNSTLTEVLFYTITCFCYMIPATYADQSHDPLFLAFNVTGLVIYFAYAIIAINSLPEDNQLVVRGTSRGGILALYSVVMCAVIVSMIVKSRIVLGVLAMYAFVGPCAVKLGFEAKDVGPVSLLMSSSLVMILNAAIWFAYGVLVKDAFICVSSEIGLCGAGLLLSSLCVNMECKNNNNTVAPVGDGDGIV